MLRTALVLTMVLLLAGCSGAGSQRELDIRIGLANPAALFTAAGGEVAMKVDVRAPVGPAVRGGINIPEGLVLLAGQPTFSMDGARVGDVIEHAIRVSASENREFVFRAWVESTGGGFIWTSVDRLGVRHGPNGVDVFSPPPEEPQATIELDATSANPSTVKAVIAAATRLNGSIEWSHHRTISLGALKDPDRVTLAPNAPLTVTREASFVQEGSGQVRVRFQPEFSEASTPTEKTIYFRMKDGKVEVSDTWLDSPSTGETPSPSRGQ